MTHYYSQPAPETPMGWLSRAEAWLDARGKGAWIACMVLGFVFFWPIGLAFLAYMIWSKKMFGSCRKSHRHGRSMHTRGYMSGSSGNSAFDAYKADTLSRLEREQSEFEDFLQRLRDAKDKAEFDQFMTDRARAAAASPEDSADTGTPQA
ncbi:MAG: hypothetical protein CML66_14500 [Rhodobacteraceae bacterium]|nr:hypothetical protein [Paracoccaceae bacterium]QEW21240.1 hypothetical protein LA6_003448 [Marinibacterium anthonyi]|tara:strand:+ start:77 stop:526 length:450 start_codon:yes stop_codon:yes gene_type:complete